MTAWFPRIVVYVCLVSLHGLLSRAARISQIWANTTSFKIDWMPESGNRFCLCHATAQQFQKGLSFFDCIPYQRESRCDLSDFGNCTAPAGSALRCSRQLASRPSVVTGLSPGVTYAFCAIDENPLSTSGYDSFALCTRTWTLDSELRFRASAYSSFMVGLEWRLGNETEQLLNVRLCSSADGCQRACRDNLLDLRREKFVAWTDLTRQRLSLQVRRTDGVLLYETGFDALKQTPDRPCQLRASSLGPSSVRVSWTLEGGNADGFVVSHCWFRLCHTKVYPQPSLRHVYINGLLQWSRYRFTVTAFRTVNKTGIAMGEPSHAEVFTDGDLTALTWVLVLGVPAFISSFVMCRRKVCCCCGRSRRDEVWHVRHGRNIEGPGGDALALP
ncbi:uncharacterized protein LOC142588432 isoform X2 [Dermacentor variabilis]